MKKLLLILGLVLLLAATAVSALETRVLYACYANNDDYVSDNPQCQGFQSILGNFGGDQQGRDSPNTVKMLQCRWQNKDNLIAAGQCDPNTNFVGDLGYVSTVKTSYFDIPLVRCAWDKGDQHFALSYTTVCPSGSRKEGLWYMLPRCRDVFDTGRDIYTKGSVDIFSGPGFGLDQTAPSGLYEGCRDANTLVEYYCDPKVLPYGYKQEVISCPAGCVNGACQKSPEVCCMLTNDRGDRRASIMQKTQCETEAQKMGAKYTTSTKEECEKEVCCTYDGKYDFMRYNRCFERKGTVLDKTKDQCREPEPVCGNGLVERGEQCEPPATATCDARCHTIAPPLAVCPVTQAENDALLATLSQLEKERDSYAMKQVCCGTERVKAGKETRRDVRVMTLAECNNMAKEQPIFGLFNPERCEAKICCAMPNQPPSMHVFRECIMNNGAEVEGAKCVLVSTPAPVCGNGIKETGEACETEKDCGEGMQCSDCKCMKINIALPPTGTPLAEDQVWHYYQCTSSVYVNNQDVGSYGTSLMGPPGCGSFAATVDHDLGYLLRQTKTGMGAIRYCQHAYGQYPYTTTETDIKFNANCDYDERQLTTTQTISPNAVTAAIKGYAFTTQQTGTKPMYKCVKSVSQLRYNFKISSSANCNAGQPGWEGYSNAGTLGYWLTQPLLPTGI